MSSADYASSSSDGGGSGTAVVVGFIVFALFMPLLTMMQQMSKR